MIAAALAAGVVQPAGSGLGGGGFAVVVEPVLLWLQPLLTQEQQQSKMHLRFPNADARQQWMLPLASTPGRNLTN